MMKIREHDQSLLTDFVYFGKGKIEFGAVIYMPKWYNNSELVIVTGKEAI